ncbi:hypothetical protein [Methylococcus mesophilus]|uniref:hypothetical protein n=1 Tax=Methylococcus mesophilus TaxID=2993564 RepID=UPI00224AD476|nr:hypothetical protein [Methylococcus mesophilus]UZR27463.1 hypothetical protein OOT43_12035 [Methylococcus mesophilus]
MSINEEKELIRLNMRKYAALDDLDEARRKLSEAQREYACKRKAHQKAVQEYLDYAERRV